MQNIANFKTLKFNNNTKTNPNKFTTLETNPSKNK